MTDQGMIQIARSRGYEAMIERSGVGGRSTVSVRLEKGGHIASHAWVAPKSAAGDYDWPPVRQFIGEL